MATEAQQPWQSLFKKDSEKESGAQYTKLNQPTPIQGAPVQSAAPGQPAPQKPQQVGSGNFTNLQKIAGANVGAGQQMAQKVGQQGQQASAAAKAVQEQTAGQVGSYKATEQKGQQAIQGGINTLANPTSEAIGYVNQGAIDYANRTGPDNITLANQLLNTGINSSSGLLSTVSDVNSGLQSEQGIADLLQRNLKGLRGSGGSALDTALLQSQGANELGKQKEQIGNYLQQLTKGQKNLQAETGSLGDLATKGEALRGDFMGSAKKAQEAFTQAQMGELEKSNAQINKDTELLNNWKTGTPPATREDQERLESILSGAGIATRRAAGSRVGPAQLDYNTYGGDVKINPAAMRQLKDVVDKKDLNALEVLRKISGLNPDAFKDVNAAATPLDVNKPTAGLDLSDVKAKQDIYNKTSTQYQKDMKDALAAAEAQARAASGNFTQSEREIQKDLGFAKKEQQAILEQKMRDLDSKNKLLSYLKK